jgi:uncharacterized protein YkwD
LLRIFSFLFSLMLFIPSAHAITTSAYRVLALINIEREERGLPRLIMDEKLAAAARSHAADMSRRKYFSHTSPNGVGMGSRLRKAGATYTAAGENIAHGQTSAPAVVDAWMNSPGHRRNILHTKYRKVGIARFNDYWVQDFSN